MGATILETLSNRKLVIILAILLLIQVLSFYIGAFLTPSPSSFEQFTSVHCHRKDRRHFAIPRYHRVHDSDVGKNCDRSSGIKLTGIDKFETTTFAVQLPLPRDGMDLAYSRWMQTLLVILIPEFQYEPLLAANNIEDQQMNSPVKLDNNFQLLIDVDLSVKNGGDKDWSLYARRLGLKRTIKCHSHDLKQSHKLDCDLIQLFELQSLHYDYYLINFEIREDKSTNSTRQFPGKLNEITGVAIHHNGGFTQIWLTLKTVYFALTLATLIWYCKRLNRLNRNTILIERLLIGLGTALTQLNAPIELLTLYIEIPFMTFMNDLRQGIFYCVLLSFWIVFVGEHLLDGARKNSKLASYIKELLAICVASLALLIFDLSERGIQALDPFLTIWESKPNLANLSILIASCASLAYLCFLAYYICLAYGTISGKQSSLPEMQITKRLKYQGMIYRFKFLLFATIICALSTFIFYGLSQRNDWSYDEDTLGSTSTVEWTSAMLITVCAMWNLYVIVLMILYAPSHKGMIVGATMSDQIEFDCLTDDREEFFEGDMDLLQQLANKANLD